LCRRTVPVAGLLPALYGGETSGTFKALVVLQNPLFPRTEQLWRQLWPTRCATPDEAVRRHREIFFRWAFGSAFADLFRCLAGEPSTVEDFFRSIYVTDIWKDAKDSQHVNIKKADSLGAAYWRSLLQQEIKSISTERVIFIGREACDAGWDHVPPGTPREHIPFSRTRTFKARLRELLASVGCESVKEESSEVHAGLAMSETVHNWILNDAINHNKFGDIPASQPRIRMNLSYQGSRIEEEFFVGSFPLAMDGLLSHGLVRRVRRGFRLRFVRNLRDDGIYIQLNQHSPSRFVAKAPANAL
jgi:hypothetical protein